MNRALVVIDVQESFRQRPSWAAVSNPDIVDRVLTTGRPQLGPAATSSSGCCTASRAPARRSTRDRTRPPACPVSSRCADEPVITKTSINAFTTTNLQQLLTTHGVRELIDLRHPDRAVLRDHHEGRSDLGYDVTFVTEATATFPIPHRDCAQRPPVRRGARRPHDARHRGDRRAHGVRAGRAIRHDPHARRARAGRGGRRRGIVGPWPLVVFVLVPRLHLLDLAGPAQVFSTAADLGMPYASRTWPSTTRW